MMDASFLAELRAWAREGAAELERLYRPTGPTAVTDDVVLVAYRRCTALDTLLTARLDGERARLAAAFEEAENKRKSVAREHGDWTMIAHYHDERVGKALAAMANFDAATKGGE